MNKSRFIRRDAINVNHRLLREEREGGRSCHQVYGETFVRPVSGKLNLYHVLQFVVDGLNQRLFARENLVCDGHDRILHIVLQPGSRVESIDKELGEDFHAEVSIVSGLFSEDLFDEGLVAVRFPVIDGVWRNHGVKQVPLFVTTLVQYELIEPSLRAVAPRGMSREDLMEMSALVPAYPQSGVIDGTDSRAASNAVLLDKQDEGDGYLPLLFDNAVIGNSLRKRVLHILLNFIQI